MRQYIVAQVDFSNPKSSKILSGEGTLDFKKAHDLASKNKDTATASAPVMIHEVTTAGAVVLRKTVSKPSKIEELTQELCKKGKPYAEALEEATKTVTKEVEERRDKAIAAERAKFEAQTGGGNKKEPGKVRPAAKVKSLLGKASALVLFCLFAVSASAQTDITAQLGTTTIGAAATNTTASLQHWRWTKDDALTVQATVTAADAGTSNVTFRVDTSVDAQTWVASQYALTFAANGSNVANTTIVTITNTVGAPYWRVGNKESLQTNAVTLSGVSFYLNPQ